MNDKVADMKALVDRGLQGVRNATVNLRSTLLALGLAPAIEAMCLDFSKQTDVACELHIPQANLDLDEQRLLVVFRIVQEALTNIARYAAASQVVITINCCGNDFCLAIRDNGRGFDLVTANNKGAFGLIGMRERVNMLGGRVNTSSTPGQGTAIGVMIPITIDTVKGKS